MIVGKKRPLGGWWGPPLWFLAPAVVLFALLFAAPAVSSLYVSLCKWTGFTPAKEYAGLDNFIKLFGTPVWRTVELWGLRLGIPWVSGGDEKFWYGVRNNLWIMTAGGVVFFAFAFLFSAALNSKRLRGAKFFQTMIFFPAFISVVGTATFWKLVYDPDDGLINLTLRALGAKGVQWLAAENAINSIIIMMVWAGVGGTMILLLAGMRRIPKDYYEAAMIDGASAPQQFFYVTVPMMREVILIALSLWMIGSMKTFGGVQTMLGPSIHPRSQVISTLQYEYAFSNRSCIFWMGRATAMAIVQLIMVLSLVAIVRLFREKKSVEY